MAPSGVESIVHSSTFSMEIYRWPTRCVVHYALSYFLDEVSQHPRRAPFHARVMWQQLSVAARFVYGSTEAYYKRARIAPYLGDALALWILACPIGCEVEPTA